MPQVFSQDMFRGARGWVLSHSYYDTIRFEETLKRFVGTTIMSDTIRSVVCAVGHQILIPFSHKFGNRASLVRRRFRRRPSSPLWSVDTASCLISSGTTSIPTEASPSTEVAPGPSLFLRWTRSTRALINTCFLSCRYAIWEAVRASSAAPGYFDEFQVTLVPVTVASKSTLYGARWCSWRTRFTTTGGS